METGESLEGSHPASLPYTTAKRPCLRQAGKVRTDTQRLSSVCHMYTVVHACIHTLRQVHTHTRIRADSIF